MIAFLHGKLAEAAPTNVIVDCDGVGYSVFIPLSSYDKLPPKGGEVKLLTYHHVVAHEGTQQLFGFVTPEEREMFLLLISISGIGPKLALNILSSTSISTLRSAIASGDTKTLSDAARHRQENRRTPCCRTQGQVGAAPIRGKGRAATAEEQKLTDAVLALVSLGYKQMDAHKAVLAAAEKLGPEAGVENLSRLAAEFLKLISSVVGQASVPALKAFGSCPIRLHRQGRLCHLEFMRLVPAEARSSVFGLVLDGRRSTVGSRSQNQRRLLCLLLIVFTAKASACVLRYCQSTLCSSPANCNRPVRPPCWWPTTASIARSAGLRATLVARSVRRSATRSRAT